MQQHFKKPTFPLHIPTRLRCPAAAFFTPDNSQHPNRFLPPPPPTSPGKPSPPSVHPLPPPPPESPVCAQGELSEGQVCSEADLEQTDQDMCIETMLCEPEPFQEQQPTVGNGNCPSQANVLKSPSPPELTPTDRLLQMLQQILQGDIVAEPTNHSSLSDPRVTKFTWSDPAELESKMLCLVASYRTERIYSMLIQDGKVQYRVLLTHRESGSERLVDFSREGIRKLSLLCGRDLLLPYLQAMMDKLPA